MIDTRGHMIAAYVVATVIYVLYAASLWWRARNLRARHPEARSAQGPRR